MVPWLAGVIPAVVTPFDKEGKINEHFLRSEIEFHIQCGVRALCAGGSTGEGAGLRPDEVKQLNTVFVDQAKGRVPVIGGVIPDNTDEAVELGRAAKQAGAAALQVTPPHYIFQPTVADLVAFYSRIKKETGLGIILYNVLPWGQVTTDGVAALLEAEAIIAVKQSGTNMHQVADMVQRFGKTIPVLSAVDDLLYPSFVIGAHGTLSAIASVLPKQTVELYDAVQQGNHPRALELHSQLLLVWRAMEDLSRFVGRVKYAIELQGRSAGLPRHPQRPASVEDQVMIRKAFEEAGIPIPLAETA